MNPELVRMKAHEKALEEFLKGPVHVGYVTARKHELDLVKEAILDLDPADRAGEIEMYKLRGEMRLLENLIDNFPNALDDLKDQISDLEDEEADLGRVKK